MFRKWICKIFKLVPKEDYDKLNNEYDNLEYEYDKLKAFYDDDIEEYQMKEDLYKEAISIRDTEIIDLQRGNAVLEMKNVKLARENTELKKTLEKCHATPCEFVGISYSSLFPKNCTEEMLREAAWNKICDKVKNNGVQYDFRDGECVATLSVLK